MKKATRAGIMVALVALAVAALVTLGWKLSHRREGKNNERPKKKKGFRLPGSENAKPKKHTIITVKDGKKVKKVKARIEQRDGRDVLVNAESGKKIEDLGPASGNYRANKETDGKKAWASAAQATSNDEHEFSGDDAKYALKRAQDTAGRDYSSGKPQIVTRTCTRADGKCTGISGKARASAEEIKASGWGCPAGTYDSGALLSNLQCWPKWNG